MSFRFFSAVTLIFFEAGLAGRSMNSPGLNGLGTFFCAALAGTCLRVIFTRPGIWNTPGPLPLIDFLISLASASRTAATSFFGTFVDSAILLRTSLLLGALGFFAPDGAAG